MRDNFKSEEYYKKLYEQDTRFLEFNESTLKNVIEEKGELKDSKYYPYDMAHFCDRIS